MLVTSFELQLVILQYVQCFVATMTIMRANIVTETEENFALTYEKEDLDCNWVDVDYRFCFSKFLSSSLGKIFEIQDVEDAKNLLKEEKMIIPFIITS